MLADRGSPTVSSGRLKNDVHLKGEWRASLIAFLASLLPVWRDDPTRPPASNETTMSAQLCAFLNSTVRLSEGWDFLQFRREEPDEVHKSRAIDLIAAPNGANIWIEGRQFGEYNSLFPIECKRLPTPKGTKRDEREYLFSKHSSTGGIERFKRGHHGAAHQHAAMIAYVEDGDISYWADHINKWIALLCKVATVGWSSEDSLVLQSHNIVGRAAHFRSCNSRSNGLDSIVIDHLWIEL